MMQNYYSNLSWGFGLHLHMVFMAVAFTGFIFLIVWAVKVMSKEQLRNWTIALLVVGILGSLLTCNWAFGSWHGANKNFPNGYYMMDGENWPEESWSKEDRESVLDEMRERMGIEDEVETEEVVQ